VLQLLSQVGYFFIQNIYRIFEKKQQQNLDTQDGKIYTIHLFIPQVGRVLTLKSLFIEVSCALLLKKKKKK
jgi:hypothetical protein